MKAEHRKELQTNVLADRMGRVLQRVKGRPSRNTVLTVLLCIVLLLAFLFWRITSSGRQNLNARLWTAFESGHAAALDELVKKYGKKEPGKAARYQFAWFALWEGGIKLIPTKVWEAVPNIKAAQAEYRKLAEECKDDPVLGPEALYNIAVADEALAFIDPEKQLNEALDAYRLVVKRYDKSAHAQDAKKRADELDGQENPQARRRIQDFYTAMGNRPEIMPLIPLLRQRKE